MKKKVCSKCNLPKREAEFPARKTGWKPKPDSWCYTCRAAAQKKRRQSKPVPITAPA